MLKYSSFGNYKLFTQLSPTPLTAPIPARSPRPPSRSLRTGLEVHGNFGLVMDGESLTLALHSSETRHQLLEIATRCQAVVCCRMSPMQKAEVGPDSASRRWIRRVLI